MLCPQCQATNPDDAAFCMKCGADLTHSTETPQEKPCPACSGLNLPDANFCRHCGARLQKSEAVVPVGLRAGAREFGRARLVSVKDESRVWPLPEERQTLGRSAAIAIDDPTLSSVHATFAYINGKLIVRDEESHGVYVRIKAPVELKDGAYFRLGAQVLRVRMGAPVPDASYKPSVDRTTFVGAPISWRPTFALQHILAGGRVGGVWYPQKEVVTLGKEACDLTFPQDTLLSPKHARVTKSGAKYFLGDSGSKGGTFIRLRPEQEHELVHGDLVLLGGLVLRVENNG